MDKFSLGDLVINQKADSEIKGTGGYSYDKLLQNLESLDAGDVKAKSNNAIVVDRNPNGSVKYTFDNIYENKELADVAKKYYYAKDSTRFESDKEAIDYYISDRTWKQANSLSLGKELFYVTGKDVTQDQKARLAYLTRTWDDLPDFYEEGGRGAGGFFKNLGIGILDPINILGAGVGGQVAKQAFKEAGKGVLKETIKKGVAKKTVAKELLTNPNQLASISATARKNAILKGSASMSAIDGLGYGMYDIADQLVEKEIDLRERLDPVRTGTVALTAAGLGFFIPAATGMIGNKIANIKAAKNTNLPTKALKDDAKAKPKANSESLNDDINSTKIGTYVRTNLVDQWDFVKVLQEEITGVGGDVMSLKKLYKEKKFKVDPILEPYFQLRTLAASSTRAHNFVMDGVYLPPKETARMASYTKGQSKGLHQILKPFDDNNEVNEFLSYIAALRQNFKVKRNPKLENQVPMTKQLRQQYIDFAELTPSQYQKKYGEKLTRKTNFTKYLNDFSKFTDDLLEYQIRSGLITLDQAKRIKKENPFFIPLTRQTEVKRPIIEGLKQTTTKILGISRPAAKKFAEKKQEGAINLYDNMITYVYQTVNAADKNRAKLSFYNMLEKGEKLGKIQMSEVARKVTGNRFIEINKVATKNVENAYKKAGSEISFKDNSVPDNIDIATFSSTFRPEKGVDFVDVVYRNGKAEYYEIVNPNLAEAFKTIGSDAMDLPTLRAVNNTFSKYSRWASRAITYSPPFVAFNMIRDTLSGAVNSAFGLVGPNGAGFIPGFSSVKGFIDTVVNTDLYKKALLNGLGYSSRSQTERVMANTVEDMIQQASKTGIGQDVVKYYKNILTKFIMKPTSAGWRGYSSLVEKVEYASRLAEFQLAKSAGFSDIGASFAGREVATDFGMRGSSKTLNWFNRNTMFLNASLQGLYKTSRLFKEQPARAAGVIATTIVSPSVALYALNSRHAEYAQVPDRIKQLNYLIPNYTLDENGNQVLDKEVPFIAIPKPYDLGIFANIAEGILDGLAKGSDGVTKQYIYSSFGQISPSLPIPTAIRPWIEMAMNKQFYTGSPVLGMYERMRLDELQARDSTREIAKKISNYTSNLNAFFTRQKEGSVKNPIFSPIEVDYLIGAYFTGIMQYPFDIMESRLEKERSPLMGEKRARRPDESDFSSWSNAASIVTRRFKVASPIKNSQYHAIWKDLIEKAKKYKQIDIGQTDFDKSSDSRIIGLFDRVLKNVEEGKPFEEKEVESFRAISPIIKEVVTLLQNSRMQRKETLASPMDGKTKLEISNILLRLENQMLQTYADVLADTDIDFIFDKTFGLGSVLYGTAEKAYERNPLIGTKNVGEQLDILFKRKK